MLVLATDVAISRNGLRMSEPITDVESTRKRHAIECSSCFENRRVVPVVIGHCRADPQRAELLQTTVLTNGCRANYKLSVAVAKQMRAGD